MKHLLTITLLLILIFSFSAQPAQAESPGPVVHAVLFYSPSCGHCHYVMTEILPPLQEQYGEQLIVVEIDVSTPEGQALYQTAVEEFQTPETRLGVPTLIVGENYLVGSGEIPELFPGLIANGLATGGIAWPKITGLEALIRQLGLEADNKSVQINTSIETNGADNPLWLQNFKRDLHANILAVIVLITLITSLILSVSVTLSNSPMPGTKSWYTNVLFLFTLLGIPSVLDLTQTHGIALVWGIGVAVIFVVLLAAPILLLNSKRKKGPILKNWFTWAVPLIAVAGLLVSTYMAFIETTQATPVCGPVGDCGTVQDSEYAILFGILPVGIFGVMGNIALLAAWLMKQFGPDVLKKLSALALWGMSVFGVLFSTYLTFLEPFVIGATCMWCITSAVTMILMLWVTTPAAKEALASSGEEFEGLKAVS